HPDPAPGWRQPCRAAQYDRGHVARTRAATPAGPRAIRGGPAVRVHPRRNAAALRDVPIRGPAGLPDEAVHRAAGHRHGVRSGPAARDRDFLDAQDRGRGGLTMSDNLLLLAGLGAIFVATAIAFATLAVIRAARA